MSKPENAVSAFGGTVLKMLVALAIGDVKGVFDGGVDLTSAYKNRKSGAKDVLGPLEVTRQDILKQLASLAEQTGGKVNIHAVEAVAANTLQCGFSFESLMDNWRKSPAVVQAWCRENRTELAVISGHDRNFHDALLTQIVEALWDRLHEMPGFMTWFMDAYNQQRGEHKWHGEAIRQLMGAKGEEFLAFEPKYRAAVAKELDWVELFIERPDLEQESTKQMLSVAYVTLTLARGRFDAEASGDVSAESLLDGLPADTPRALLVGPAGCGKTTLMRWAAIEAAREPTRAYRQEMAGERHEKMLPRRADALAWRDKVPFFVRLRDFPTGAFPTPDELHRHGATRLKAPDGWAESVLQAGRGLLLLDGLDELSGAQRRKALTWIQGLIDDFGGGNVFVATSRPEALKPEALEQAGFAEYNVRNLTPEGKRQFVRRWHRAVARQLGGSREKLHKLAQKRKQLLRELETNHSAAHLASNPLLCALLCALNRVYRTNLPENLRDLCESACKMLLWDRDRLTEVTALDSLPAYSALKKTQRLLLVRNLAYDAVQKETDVIPRKSAIVQISEALNPGGVKDRSEAEEVLTGLLERSGLLRMCRSNDVEFVHNALRDYLASLAFIQRDEYEFLAGKVMSENLARWEPVLLFAAAVEHNEEFGPNLVQAILSLPGRGKRERYRRNVMALKTAVRVCHTLPSPVRKKLDEIRVQMLPVNTVDRANTLAECGTVAVEHLAWRSDMSAEVEIACARGLAKMNSEQAVTMLHKFLHRDAPPAVLDELANVLPAAVMAQTVNVLTIPFVLQKLQDTYDEPKEYRPFVHDLAPLLNISDLYSLSLTDIQITDCKILTNLSNLNILSLDNTQITDLTPLANLNCLYSLYLSNSQITNLRPIEGLSGLRLLFLSNTPITDLTPLEGLSGLTTLHLDNTQVVDIMPLTALTGLQTLILDNTKITRLSPLEGLSDLQVLSLSNTPITDLTPLESLNNLEKLYLDGTQVADLTPIYGMKSLKTLTINETLISDEEKQRFQHLFVSHTFTLTFSRMK